MDGFKILCEKCGQFDSTDMEGRYTDRHICENLNINQLLLRIAKALEKFVGRADGLGSD